MAKLKEILGLGETEFKKVDDKNRFYLCYNKCKLTVGKLRVLYYFYFLYYLWN